MRNDRKGKESVSDTMENQKSNTQSDCTIIIKWPVMISSEDKKKMYDEYLKMKEKGLILLTHGESVMLAPDGAKIDVEFERGQEESEDARREEGSAATEKRKSVNEKKYTIKDWLEGKITVQAKEYEEYIRLMDIAEKYGLKWDDDENPHKKDYMYNNISGNVAVKMLDKKRLFRAGWIKPLDEIRVPFIELDLMGIKRHSVRDWLRGKIGVKCRTVEEYMRLMDIAEDEDFLWTSDAKPNEVDDEAKVRMIYPIGTQRGYRRISRYTGKNIVWFEEVEWGAPKRASYALHITSAGNTTHAVLKKDGKVTKRSMAACHPDDQYDFLTGARAALDRMQGKKPISLEDVPTEKLVEELSKREGVKTVNPGGHVMFLGIKKEVAK